MSVADGRYDLLETMAFDPHEGVRLLELHLGRLKDSAQALGFAFDRHSVRNELQAATFRLRELSRVRLLVSRQGSVSIEVREHRTWPKAIMQVKVVPRLAAATDPRLEHKTTDRSLYRDALRLAHARAGNGPSDAARHQHRGHRGDRSPGDGRGLAGPIVFLGRTQANNRQLAVAPASFAH